MTEKFVVDVSVTQHYRVPIEAPSMNELNTVIHAKVSAGQLGEPVRTDVAVHAFNPAPRDDTDTAVGEGGDIGATA